MNWRLILVLSGFGFAMGLATVFVIPSNVEPAFWLVIFIVCAFIIAQRVSSRVFLHGLAVSLVNSVWITASHVLFFETYFASHPQEAAMTTSMPLGNHPRLLMLVMGPIIGLVSGVILGLFCLGAAWALRRRAMSHEL